MAKSPIFRTQLSNDTDKFTSEPGSKLLAKYALKVDEKTGYEYLAPTGELLNISFKSVGSSSKYFLQSSYIWKS